MNTEEPLDFDDLGEALREGRALRPARGYRIRFAQDDLNFRDLDVADPVPLGRQILTAAGRDLNRAGFVGGWLGRITLPF